MAQNPQTTATIILIIFSIVTLISWYIAPGITEWSKTAGPVESTLTYILVNPVYLVLIVYLSRRYSVRGFIASLFIVLALDIQSLPHVVTDGVATDPNLLLFSDSIIHRFLGVPKDILYTVVPIGLVVGAYEIVAPGTFVGIFKRYVG
jgi:hypothetical protein